LIYYFFGNFDMNKNIILLTFCLGLFGALWSVTAPAEGISSAEKWMEELEKSGAIDRAVQRSLERIQKEQALAQQQEEMRQQAVQLEKAKFARKVDVTKDMIFGNPKAEISIIEYSDFECPYCKRFHGNPEQVVTEMNGEVNLVWRHYPLSFHDPMATKEAVASYCASEQGGSPLFWKFADGVMKNTGSNGQGLPSKDKEDPLVGLAVSLGLDKAKFQACQDSDQAKRAIQADLDDGVNAGINGTPGVILVNHKTGAVGILAGAVPVENIKAEVKKLQLQ
jgi:hypothetical protein